MERVYVGNLPPDIRIKDIDDFFRPFGKLIYIDVNHRANPVHAFVQFDSARNAFLAVKSRHGYDYEGYTLQLRLVENEVRKRRDATPPPPPPPMLSDYGSQNNRASYNNDFKNNNNRGGYNDFGNNNYNVNRMSGNFPNTSLQSSSSSQWASNNRSNMTQHQQQNMSQYSANNRLNTPQQIMTDYQQQAIMPYSSSNRSNIQQNNSNRSNMLQNNNYNRSNIQQNNYPNRSNMQQNNSNGYNVQQNINANRSNMQQTYSNSNRSNMPQQYSNSNRSDMQQQNINNYSNMPQQNMNNYPNYSNMPQQQNMNMTNYSNNSSWNNSIDNLSNVGWNAGNNNYNNAAPNNMYNPNNDAYDSFTNGLSGSGRKWFNRYIRKGFSPEMARSKALEHRTLPYLRDNPKPINLIPDDSTNMALETIGNTILSLLSTNPEDNFNNENHMTQGLTNWGSNNFQSGFSSNVGGGNYQLPGPSSSGIRGNMVSQGSAGGHPRNRVSKQQYLKSVDALKNFRGKIISAKDRLFKKYHTKIVKDYEDFEKNLASNNRATRTLSNQRNDREIASKAIDGKTYTQLSIALKKKKQQLFIAARRMRMEPNWPIGGAYKKRMKILMNEAGFTELEAKALAIHPMEKLKDLLSLKADYDNATRKPNSTALTKQIGNKSTKSVTYRSDLNYLKMYEKHKLDDLSPRIKSAIRVCLTKIHKYEKEANLPLTKSKFTKLLARKPDQKPKTTTTTATRKEQGVNKKITTTTTKKTVTGTTPKKPVAEEKGNDPPNANKDEHNIENDDVAVNEPEQHNEVNT